MKRAKLLPPREFRRKKIKHSCLQKFPLILQVFSPPPPSIESCKKEAASPLPGAGTGLTSTAAQPCCLSQPILRDPCQQGQPRTPHLCFLSAFHPVSPEKILTALGQEWVWMLLQLHQIFRCLFSLRPAAAETQTQLLAISFGLSPPRITPLLLGCSFGITWTHTASKEKKQQSPLRVS